MKRNLRSSVMLNTKADRRGSGLPPIKNPPRGAMDGRASRRISEEPTDLFSFANGDSGDHDHAMVDEQHVTFKADSGLHGSVTITHDLHGGWIVRWDETVTLTTVTPGKGHLTDRETGELRQSMHERQLPRGECNLCVYPTMLVDHSDGLGDGWRRINPLHLGGCRRAPLSRGGARGDARVGPGLGPGRRRARDRCVRSDRCRLSRAASVPSCVLYGMYMCVR